MRSIHNLAIATTLLAACATDALDEPPSTEPQAKLLCNWPPLGWKTRLQGTTTDPNHNINEGAAAVATDLGQCFLYTGGDTVGALEDQTALGGDDAYLTQYSTGGGVVWTRQLGSSADDRITGIAVGPDHNIVVTGCTAGTITGSPELNAGGEDAFVAKYDSAGNQLWLHQLGSTGDDCGHGVAIGVSGGVFVTGVAHGNLAGTGPYWGAADGFLAKYDPSGARQFVAYIGSPADDEANAIAIGSSGNVFVAGYTHEDLAHYMTPGSPVGGWAGGDDLFLGKYDPVTGAQIWLAQRGTIADERAAGVAVNASNEVFVTGWTDGWLDGNIGSAYDDVFVLSYSTSGTWRWTDQRGSTAMDRGQAIAVDANGAPYAVGFAMGSVDGKPYGGDSDMLVMKYSRAGARRWLVQLDAADNQRAQGVAISGTDDIFVTGFVHGDLNGVSNHGGNDAATIHVDSSGTIY